jgi:hypothetical protein
MGTGDTTLAQTFTSTETGMLSELDLGPECINSYMRRQGNNDRLGTSADLYIELRPTHSGGEPSSDEHSAMLRISLPVTEMPSSGQSDRPLMRFDLRRFGIGVRRGQVLAIVLRPPAGTQMQYQAVNGKTYTRGEMYQLQNGAWEPERMSVQLQFRVAVDPNAPPPVPPPNAATSTPTAAGVATNAAVDATPASEILRAAFEDVIGTVVAECLPRPRVSATTTVAPASRSAYVSPAVSGHWQMRGVAFQDGPRLILELIVFNGTNARSTHSMMPISITVARDGERAGFTAYPPRPTTQPGFPTAWAGGGGGYRPYSPYGDEFYGGVSSILEPAAGYVRHFDLLSLGQTLTPGRYNAIISLPPDIAPEALITPFDVR